MMLFKQKAVQAFATLTTFLFLLFTPGCQPAGPLLERIQQRGTLIVATRHEPSTYFEVQDDLFSGFEYDLVTRYADSLGVDVEWQTYDDTDVMLRDLGEGKVHLVAAGIAITPEREKLFHFTPAYTEAAPVLVYRKDRTPPASLAELSNGRLVVSDQGAHAERLAKLKSQHPGLTWDERNNLGPITLLSLLNEGEADFAIINNNVFEQLRSLFPELEKGLALDDPQPLAWALNRQEDSSLLASIQTYYQEMEEEGFLEQLREQYFSDRNFDYVGARAFLTHIDARLKRYKPWFKDVASETGFDWRLLAAVGYQESMWNPNAVSPTGVTGVMMLTMRAAREVGVTDRRDPMQSIVGGSRYFKRVYDKLPESVKEPHRTWFALAAYNMGYGHLLDARRLTAQKGGDPDSWHDVEKHIPLLQNPAYYQHARHGYSRSARQAVAYVRNVKRYYDTLILATAQPVKPFVPMPETVAALPQKNIIL